MSLTRLQESTFANFSRVREHDKSENIPQPKKYNQQEERDIRILISRIADYAEAGPRFDPDGKYLCGTCCLRADEKPTTTCTHVTGDISNLIGSCRMYILGDAAQYNPIIAKVSQAEALYAERPKAKAYGCSRCSYAEAANQTDSDGRKLWCGKWGCRVKSLSCCANESGPDMVKAPGDKKEAK